MTEIAQLLREQFDIEVQAEAARALEVDRSNLPNKLIGTQGPFYTIALARKINMDVLEALVRGSWITPEEVAQATGSTSLYAASDAQLSSEIVRRVRDGGFHATLTDPIEVEGEDFTGD